MIELDGSQGEGGGQILRTALTLSSVTGAAFQIRRIRAGRERPGLLRQHLAAVRAAAAVTGARVTGAELGSRELTFEPGPVAGGDHRIAVGSAGSATLVAQTLLPVLLRAEGPACLSVEGGTHNPAAPPFSFLERAYLPLLARMGARAELNLERAGFFPAGGGRLTLRTWPSPPLRPLTLEHPGAVQRIRVEALVAGLARSIGQREISAITRRLAVRPEDLRVSDLPAAWGPGNAVLITIERERLTELFTGFGRRGVPAEVVGREAAEAARRYLDSGAAVGEHLADQLLLPMALAGSGRLTAAAATSHLRTNARIVQRFLPVRVTVGGSGDGAARVAVSS